jgi:hypothetical protein
VTAASFPPWPVIPRPSLWRGPAWPHHWHSPETALATALDLVWRDPVTAHQLARAAATVGTGSTATAAAALAAALEGLQ